MFIEINLGGNDRHIKHASSIGACKGKKKGGRKGK